MKDDSTRLADIFYDLEEALCDSCLWAADRVVVIAMTPRTGSTQFCSCIEEAYGLGNVTEILNPRGPAQHLASQLGVSSFVSYIRNLRQKADKAMVFKVSWDDFFLFKDQFSLLSPRPSFIFLDRLDIFEQAWSLYRARRSGHWHTQTESNYGANGNTSVGEIDKKLFEMCLINIRKQKRSWEHYFWKHNIQPARFFYEFLQDDWSSGARNFGSIVGLQPVKDLLHVKGVYRKNSGGLPSDEVLIQQLREEFGMTWLIREEERGYE